MAAPCNKSRQPQLLGQADFPTKSYFCTASRFARETLDLSGAASSCPLPVPLATGIPGSTATFSQPSPSGGKGKAASPHSFQQLGSTHLKTALCWFFPPGTKSTRLHCPAQEAKKPGQPQHSWGNAKLSFVLKEHPRGHRGTEYPRQDTPAQPSSIPAPWGQGMRPAQLCHSKQRPLVSPCVPK